MNNFLIETNFSSPLKIVIIFFIIFFVFNIFFWIKIIFEINKFRKLEKISEELLVFSSSFYLNKLIEIKNLALKNKSYHPIFLTFYHDYQELFINNLLVLFKKFLENLNEKEDWSTFFVENTKKITVLQKITQNKKKIKNFAKNLRLFSIWENFFLDKVNDMHYVLEKSWEEIEKNKMILTTDKEIINDIFRDLERKIEYLEHSIYKNSYHKTFIFFQNLEKKITDFVEKILFWIKLQKLILLYLPKKKTDLQKLIQKINISEKEKSIVEFYQNIALAEKKCENLLKEFEIQPVKEIILNLIDDIEQHIEELKNYQELRKIFRTSFKTANIAFEKIKRNFYDFKSFIKSIQKNHYIRNLKTEKKLDFDKLINQTQKEIDWLFIKNYQINSVYFFSDLLIRMKSVLKNLQKLIFTYHQVDRLIIEEKEEKEYFFLTLNNLNTIINKKQNFFLKSLYKKKLAIGIEMFIDFEKSILLSHNSYLDYDLSFNDLQNKILTLKMEVQNTILLKNLAENLFVFTNKYRFYNSYLFNHMLNCEVLFLKQDYKGVVDGLIELHNNQLKGK